MTLSVEWFAGATAEWDAFLPRASGATACHRFAWRPLIEDVFGHECPYLAARDDGGTIVGVLPLVRIRSLLFGHYLVSMPFLNYGGPVGSAEAVDALAARAVALAREGGVRLLELRSRVPQPVRLEPSHRKITVVLDLPDGGAEALWNTLPAKLRSQVRRPQKEGVTVRFGPEQVEPFYRVFAEHMRDLGTPVQSRRLYEALPAAFGDDVWFACAYLGRAPIAAGCGFRWGDEFEMTWASSLRAYSRLAPNMLLYWAVMERCAAEGLRHFNFGRCTPGSGTHRFKSQWGEPRDEPLWWYQDPSGTGAATPSPDAGRYAWGPQLWRLLPLPVANALGPRIVRFIP